MCRYGTTNAVATRRDARRALLFPREWDVWQGLLFLTNDVTPPLAKLQPDHPSRDQHRRATLGAKGDHYKTSQMH